jgi:hypothetical protein
MPIDEMEVADKAIREARRDNYLRSDPEDTIRQLKNVESRLWSLSKYYHEKGYLISELSAALENIEDASDLQTAKAIANKALDLIIEKRDDCYPNISPNGEFHTGHLYPEYLSLPNPKHTQVFEPRPWTPEKIAKLRRAAGIKEQ